MTIHSTDIERAPGRADAERAMRVLRDWAAGASGDEIAALDPALTRLLDASAASYPDLSHTYPAQFVAGEAYRATLPDLQNGPASLIRGVARPIQHVGISNFRLPIRFATRDGGQMTLETRVTGTVALDARRKGINMSRIMRTFYAHAETAMSFGVIEQALDAYFDDHETLDARIQMRLSYPMRVSSLRSGLAGWQYYDIALELIESGGSRRRIIHLDYVYSSTCPCSLELSEHARRERGQLATPHSQRSVARISVALTPDAQTLWFEDLVELCRTALPTETQVMVKREDEQAFAELNAANPVFVEDAARLFAERLIAENRVEDFRVVASHQESLHSHDAVSILTEGPLFENASLDPHLFATLHHPG